MLKTLRSIYQRHRRGYGKRPERLKLRGLVSMVPERFRYDEDKYTRAAIVDISSSGVALENFSQFNTDDEIMLVFQLPERRVHIAGKIMRRRQLVATWLFGIKFDLATTDKRQIKAVLAYVKAEMKKLGNKKSQN